ncbi:MAG: TonB-dependent receptor [Gammaproteobacteria bacterium]|nr:TonB-dependent receptor [Gammaproteobacteria bacterium]MBQ0840924.1 TonB-dependent receptor [Gammaproteobacteria bacterium]
MLALWLAWFRLCAAKIQAIANLLFSARLKSHPLLLSLCCWLLASDACGAAVSESDLLGDISQVSIASRFNQSVSRAPASVTIIDRALLDASGAQTWGDIFRLVPGFQSYATNGNRYGVSYHGFGKQLPNRLEVMVDGRSVYEPVFSSVMWSTLGVNLEDIERIEIVRGPSTASQGSNAMLGAVNIITRTPVQDSGTALTYTSGARSTRNATLRHNDRLGDMYYRLSIGYQHNDGFPAVTGEGPLEDGRELYQLAFRSTLTPSLFDSIDISLGLVRNREGLGDGDHPDEYLSTDYDSNYQSLTWVHALDSGDEVQARFYHNSLRLDNRTDLGLISTAFGIPPAAVPGFLGIPDQVFSMGLDSLASERLDLELERRFSDWHGLQTVLGLGARSEYVSNAFLFADDEKIREESFRFYSHNQWAVGRDWVFNFGVMVEDTHVGTLVSPRVGLNYEFIPNHTLRLVAGRSERSPSLSEANADQASKVGGLAYNAVIRAGEDLGEERVDHFELGYVGRFPAANIELDLSFFREQARDAVDAYSEDVVLPIPFFDDSVLVSANTGEWETTGAELQFSYKPIPGSLLRLHYAYLDLESDYVKSFEPTLRYSDFNTSRPRHSGGLLLAYQLTPRLDGSVTTYYQSKVEWRGGNPIDEFSRVDAQLSYQFMAGGSPAKIQLIAQNLGSNYSEYSRNNVFETRFYIKVEVSLP